MTEKFEVVSFADAIKLCVQYRNAAKKANANLTSLIDRAHSCFMDGNLDGQRKYAEQAGEMQNNYILLNNLADDWSRAAWQLLSK